MSEPDSDLASPQVKPGQPATRGRQGPLVRSWLVALILSAIASAIGLLAGLWFWSRPPVGRERSADVFESSFVGPAFSPQATVDDRLREAERVIQELLQAYPNSPDSLDVLARKHFMLGQFAAAKSTWETCLQIDPQFSPGVFGLGLVASDEGDYSRAAELLERAVELNAADPRTRVLYAESLIKSGNPEKAATLLESYIKNEPTSVEVVATLAQAYLELAQYEKAKVTFETVVKVAPNLKKAVYGLGRVYAHLGEREKAKEYLEKHRLLANEKLEVNRTDSKTFVDERFVRELLAHTHRDAARVYADRGQTGRAAELWRKAIFLYPPNFESLSNLLELYEKAGMDREALQVCRRLCESESGNVQHWLNRAAFSARLNRADEALQAVEKARQLDPKDPRCREAYELITKGQ